MKDQEKRRIQDAINHINTSADVDPWACEIAVAAMEALLVGGRCSGCAFESMEEWAMPCMVCKRNCKDYWRAKDDRN